MSYKTIKTKDGRTFYIGQDDTSNLRHWKYVKKEKVNGKWRYYYHDDELERKINTSKETAQKLEFDADGAAKRASETQFELNDVKEEFKKARIAEYELRKRLETYTKLGKQDFAISKTKSDLDKAVKQREKLEAKVHELTERVRKFVGQSNNMNRKSVELEYDSKSYQKEFDNAFGNKVANTLNSASDNIDRAKTWLKKLFD